MIVVLLSFVHPASVRSFTSTFVMTKQTLQGRLSVPGLLGADPKKALTTKVDETIQKVILNFTLVIPSIVHSAVTLLFFFFFKTVLKDKFT